MSLTIDFEKRRGRFVMPPESLLRNGDIYPYRNEFLSEGRGEYDFLKPNEQYLKEVFANFYPRFCEIDRSIYISGIPIFYGFSPHFRPIEIEEEMPLYYMTFTLTEDGLVFLKMIEIKNLKELYNPKRAPFESFRKNKV